ncbi:hypothetical protein TSAR_007527 [Trichomalopsis sarcophagae]|uniref:Uncharacterized protein n=1 Tax=Trichomalopsis sarcophagae TaxID=543379 RepID=A0A232EKN3_9HYME|nr:hypothetical protein TSAR_007527 [Trichomalopsis sarcophagae]
MNRVDYFSRDGERAATFFIGGSNDNAYLSFIFEGDDASPRGFFPASIFSIRSRKQKCGGCAGGPSSFR